MPTYDECATDRCSQELLVGMLITPFSAMFSVG
jgi:hypothetical protein